MTPDACIQSVSAFVQECRSVVPGEYRMWPEGVVTLYSSCFAAMTLHYLGRLGDDRKDRKAWASYMRQWQDPATGYFVGPELREDAAVADKFRGEHAAMHLTAHVLPALDLLGGEPDHLLTFAMRFLDLDALRAWLDERDWSEAWLEGNNLLFVGQFLCYLREHGQQEAADRALAIYFDWLDAQQDPRTGLWGTQNGGDPFHALYGSYHQLLVYYYMARPVPRAQQALDTTLALQHADGSFTRYGGGGSCEDVDAVDVIVNLYRRTGHRPRAVRHALEKVLAHVLRMQAENGGFVYRWGKAFMHNGVEAARVPADTADMFSTWFRVHTIALICQVLRDHPLAGIDWRFNRQCSMGWHDTRVAVKPQRDPLRDRLPLPWQQVQFVGRKCKEKLNRES